MSASASSIRVLDGYRSPDGSNYDCIVPVSGGKDSTYQVIRMLELGLNPLCVTATTDHLSEIGRRNIENIKSLGVDYIEVTTNPVVRRRINRLALDAGRRHLLARARRDLHRPGARRRAARDAADRLGREPAERVRRPGRGARRTTCSTAAGSRSSAACSGSRHRPGRQSTASSQRNLIQYTYPTDEELQRVGVTGIFLGYYLPWDGWQNALIAQAHGFETYGKTVEGSLVNYENLDNARPASTTTSSSSSSASGGPPTSPACTSAAAASRATDALELVQRHDGKFPWTYLGMPLEEILERDRHDGRRVR